MPPLSTIAALAVLASEPPVDGTELAATRQEIAALEERGRFVAGARKLEVLLPSYPQDYGLVLWAGWLRFNAGHWRRAQRHYRQAMELSQGSLDSRLGLGWSLLYDGQRRAAIETFEELSHQAPESPRVAEALQVARAQPVVVPSAWAWLTGQAYTQHPTLRGGLGGQAGLGLRIAEHGQVSVGYGFARLGYVPTDEALLLSAGQGNGFGGGAGGSGGGQGGGGYGPGYGRGTADDPFVEDTIDQHQLHAAAGVTWPVAGASLQYGWLRDEGLGDVHAMGTSLRWSPWGDLVLDASVTVESSGVRPRLAPSWRMPVLHHLWIRPGASLQVDDGGAIGTGRLTVAIHGRPGALWLGGMGGRERRPALLDVPLVLGLAEDLRWGTWLGGQVALPRGIDLLASYELYGLEPFDPEISWAWAHFVTVGMTWTRGRKRP